MWVGSVGLFTGKLGLVSEKNTLLRLSFFVVPVRKFQPVTWLPGYRCWTRCDLAWLNTCHSRVRFSVSSFEEHERRQEILRVLTPGLCCTIRLTFLGALAKLRKATVCFVMSLCPGAWNCSVPTIRIFMKFEAFSKICWENSSFIKIWQTWRKHMYIYNLLNSSQNDKFLGQKL